MVQVNRNKMNGTVTFTVAVESESRVMGLLEPISAVTVNPDITLVYDQPIIGKTTSKLSYIEKSFPIAQVKAYQHVNVPVTIRGTDIKAVVTRRTETTADYSLYIDAPSFRIDYRDLDNGTTIFSYKPLKELNYSDRTVFMLKYWTIIDEPNLDTNLFINRGVNNVFESLKRLKTVQNIKELEKTGFGFYKLYSQGIT